MQASIFQTKLIYSIEKQLKMSYEYCKEIVKNAQFQCHICNMVKHYLLVESQFCNFFYKILCILIWRMFQLILLSNLFPYRDGQFQKFACI